MRTIVRIVLGAALVILLGLTAWLGFKTVRALCRYARQHWMTVALGLGLFVTAIAGFCLYSFRTLDTKQPDNLLSVRLTPQVTQNWWSGTGYRIDFAVSPTTFITPDRPYVVTVDNGLVSWTRSVSWTKLQIALLETKVFSVGISPEQYLAMTQNRGWTIQIKDVQHERNGAYLFLILVYGALWLLGWLIRRDSLRKREATYAVS